jgi:hypothetical protein
MRRSIVVPERSFPTTKKGGEPSDDDGAWTDATGAGRRVVDTRG